MSLRDPRRTLIGLLIVLAVAELGLRALEGELPVLSEWPTMETEVKGTQLSELEETPDLLLIGSSMTEAAVDPAQLAAMDSAFNAYNSAFPFFSPAAAEIWLDEHVDLWGELDILLVGLPAWPPPTKASDDPLTSGLRAMSDNAGATNPLDQLALWRVRGLLADLDEALHRQEAHESRVWTELGHQTFYYERTAGMHAGVFPSDAEPKMDAIQSDALRRIIEKARGSGAIPIILLEPGSSPDTIEERTNDEYLKWIRSFAAELGVEVWDTYSIDWSPDLYADGTHFNERGTREYTNYLGELIKEFRSRT